MSERAHDRTDERASRAANIVHLAVWFIAGVFAAVATRFATFAATITDASGYVSAAHRWWSGELFQALPFAFLPKIDQSLALPLAYRLGAVPGTDVSVYPVGLPLAMAGAATIAGDFATYLVPPIMGALLVWSTAELARTLAGATAALIGAGLMATAAIALVMATQPMSDVPAAAWWALALVFSLRAQPLATAAAGLAVSMAVLTRPNLAPLAIVPAAFVLAANSYRRAWRGVIFAMSAAVGPILMLWVQHLLYADALTIGQPGLTQLFSRSFMRANLAHYINWYAEAHSPVVLVAVLAPWVFWRRSHQISSSSLHPRLVTLGLLAFVMGTYGSYAAFYPNPDWQFLRYLLPAFAPLYALTAAVLAAAAVRLPARARIGAIALVLVLTTGMQARQAAAKGLTQTWRWDERVVTAGRYMDAALPHSAAVLTYFHSGSTAFYTGRPILRLDLIDPVALDDVVRVAEHAGHRPFLLIDEDLERPAFLARFQASRFGRLDWPPRAVIGTYGRIVLYDVGDMERHARGDTWPVDAVR